MTSPRRPLRLLAVAFLACSAAACSKQKPALYGSSAGQGAYALGYPDQVAADRAEVAAVEAQVAAAGKDLPSYPDALSSPSWPDVLAIYRAADEDGRSASFVSEVSESEAIARFYVQEKDDMNRRVGGAAQAKAKEKSCDADLYGTTSYALGKAFEESLRDRMRGSSEAHRLLEDREDAVGKKNRPKLEAQIDAIARTSYLVHFAAPRLRERLAESAAEAKEVDSTLERVADEHRARAAAAKQTREARAQAGAREKAARAARERTASEGRQADELARALEKRAPELQKSYEAAFDALEAAVDRRAAGK